MLLDDLIRTLSPEEVTLLRDADLSPRRKAVLEAFIECRDKELPPTEQLTKELDLTRTNLYRQTSALLQDCYRILSENELEVLRLLARKFLHKHFLDEVERLEDIYRGKGDNDSLVKLYELTFTLLFRFEVRTFDLVYARSITKKYFEAKGSYDETKATFFEMRSIFHEVVAQPSRKRLKVSDMERNANELLDGIEERVQKHGDFRAKMLFHDGKQIMLDYVKWDPHERLTWLYKNRELFGNTVTSEQESYYETNELRIAELEAYIGKADAALKMYKRLHPTIDDLIKRGYLYVNAYITIAMIAEEDELAREITEYAFSRELAESNAALRVLGTTHKAVLALLRKDITAARTYIESGLAENMEDNFFFLYEVMFRCDEVVLALYHKQYELVHQLTERNKKWLRSRKYSINVSSWGYFLALLDELAIKKMTGENIKRSTLERFKTDFTSEWPQYARLVENEL